MTPEQRVWMPRNRSLEAFDYIQDRFCDIACYLESMGIPHVSCTIAMDYLNAEGEPRRYVWRDIQRDVIDTSDEADTDNFHNLYKNQ